MIRIILNSYVVILLNKGISVTKSAKISKKSFVTVKRLRVLLKRKISIFTQKLKLKNEYKKYTVNSCNNRDGMS